MAKGIRRSPAQLIAEYEQKIAALKAQTGLSKDTPAIVKLAASVIKIADTNGVDRKVVIKALTDAVIPPTTRVKKAP